MKRVTALALVLTLMGLCPAQAQTSTTGKTARKKAAPSNSAVAEQLSELKQALDAQQQQIKQLSDQIQSRDQQIQQLQQSLQQSQTTASQAESKADAAASQGAKQDEAVNALASDVKDLKQNSTNTAVALQETQTNFKKELESPIAIHYKGITLTPGGFFEASTVWRQHALASDIATPFNSIPMPGASQTRMSEFFGSGRHSRISMLFEGKLNAAKLTGYYEADFLSAGITSNNNQSNSYTLRQRQFWGQAALNNGVSFTAGQMWSLVTETKKGMDNRTEAPPMTIDPNYNVGFSFTRQYGFRVTKNFANKFWLGFALENPQAIFGGSGQANFLLGSAGTSGGAYNPTANYSFNSAPDFVFKTVAEPGFGHYELFGVVRRFRDRIFPNATATPATAAGAFNSSTTTAGIGANARVSLFAKHLDLGAHFLGGEGMGRYGASALPDVTVNADGTLAPLKSYQGLGTIEYHGAKLDVYFNGGAEFVGKSVSPFGGKLFGYGLPNANNSGCTAETVPGSGGFLPGGLANCSANTRNLIEGSVGFYYRFYRGPKGTVSWGPQYSYLVRNTWAGVGGPSLTGQPTATQSMFFTQFRYVLP